MKLETIEVNSLWRNECTRCTVHEYEYITMQYEYVADN